jgi:hypothetical protein
MITLRGVITVILILLCFLGCYWAGRADGVYYERRGKSEKRERSWF